jgi:hypothetical protein
MATWKKVIVSGSNANLSALQVDNLTSGQVVIGGGTAGNLTTTAINGTGNIVATTGATGLSASGSFSGSFQGNFVGTTNLPDLTQGTGITAFTYDGATTATVAVSGASTLSTNNISKWTGAAFANSSLTDNGTTITGTTSLQLTGANSNLSGSFSGSFFGDGSGLSGVAASFPVTEKTDLSNTDKFFINDGASKFVTYGNLLTDLAGTNLAVEGTDSLTLASTITGLTSVSATSFTGSLLGNVNGTASWATNAVTATNATNTAVTDTTTGTGPYYVTFVAGTTGNQAQLVDSAGLLFNATTNTLSTTASIATTASYAASTNNITNAITNNTDNRVLTATGGGTINGESNLTFDGTTLTITGNEVISGNLTVLGTASFQNTTNLEVADRFILLASGSNTAGDGGILVQQGTQNVGELFGFDSGATRWAFTSSFSGDSSAFTPDAFVAAAIIGAGTTPTSAPARYQVGGNIFIGTDEAIWIYS